MGTTFYQTTVVRHFPLVRLPSKAQLNYQLSPMLHIAYIKYGSSVVAMNTWAITKKINSLFFFRNTVQFPTIHNVLWGALGDRIISGGL